MPMVKPCLITLTFVSKSPLDFGEFSIRPFEINVPEHIPPVYSRPYRNNPILTEKVDAILNNSCLATGIIKHSTSE